jgi:hypothetical protein
MTVVAPNLDSRSVPDEDHNVRPSYLSTKSIDWTADYQSLLDIVFQEFGKPLWNPASIALTAVAPLPLPIPTNPLSGDPTTTIVMKLGLIHQQPSP